jgi:hypothetical protein
MKNNTDSGEADWLPGNHPGVPIKTPDDAGIENEELEWARKHVPGGRIKQPGPAGTTTKHPEKTAAGPAVRQATGPIAGAAFRKTELRDRPPIFRPEEPAAREKTLLRVMGQDAAIPYTAYEDALRTMTATIVQRQEKIAGRLAGEIDKLHDRLDVLEDRFEMAIDHVCHRLSSLEKERES